MRGKCSFSDCDFTDADDVDAAKCSSCSKMVHHICSNAVYEGELSVRVCSQRCCVSLGLKKQSNALGVSSRAPTSGSRISDGAEVHDRAARKRSLAKKMPNNNNDKYKQVKANDNKKQGQRGGNGVNSSASTTAKKVNSGKKSSGGKPWSKTAREPSTTTSKHASTNIEGITRRDELQKGTHDGESCISPSDRVLDDIAHVNDESCDDAEQEDKQASKRKKFHFTAEDDLALLREILNVQPYAAKHGSITARYQDVADNFNEHVGETLSLRTVKERFFLLVKEFKTTDSEYRKKSGVSEEYTEHKQLLQDIVDAMRDLQDEKTQKKKAVQDKSDRLKLAGEILRHQALNRRCQRTQPMLEETAGSDCEESDVFSDGLSASSSVLDNEESFIRSSTGSTKSGGGVTTAQVNAAAVEFIGRQRKRHKDGYELQQQELAFKRQKAEKEDLRWQKEFDFRQAAADRSDRKWSEEIALRRADMELRKDLLKLQLVAQNHSKGAITQALV